MGMISPDISIILPTYNEVENIDCLIDQIVAVMARRPYEIVVVDDNSPDGTAERVRLKMRHIPCLRLIRRNGPRGLAPAICDGIDASTAPVCLWMDADLSMDPALIPRFLDEIAAGADLVLGSRYIPGGGIKGDDSGEKKASLLRIWTNLRISEDSFVSAMISIVGNRLIRLILDTSVHDFSSGYFCGRKALFSRIRPDGHIVDYCISLPYRILMKGYRVVEVPMVLRPRKYGKSKTSNNILSIAKVACQCFATAIALRTRIPDERDSKK